MKERKVLLREDVVVTWAGDKHHKDGSKSTVHAAVAEKLAEQGKITAIDGKQISQPSKTKKEDEKK